MTRSNLSLATLWRISARRRRVSLRAHVLHAAGESGARSGCWSAEADTDRALRSLINRSLVVPSEELKTFVLVPLVADFLRKKKAEGGGDRRHGSEERLTLVVENGYENYDRFSVLDAAWPTVAAALPLFLAGPNDQLQTHMRCADVFLDLLDAGTNGWLSRAMPRVGRGGERLLEKRAGGPIELDGYTI